VTRLDEARRQLARQPGLGLTVLTSGLEQADGSYLGQAAGPESRLMVVSSDLVRVAATGSADTEARSDYHDAMWVYRPDQQLQRSLANQGYQPAVAAGTVTDLAGSTESVGVIRAVRNFPSEIPPETELELHAACPVLDADQQTGLHSALRRALRAMWGVSRLTIDGTGSQRTSLAAYPWIRDEGQLLAVYDVETSPDQEPPPLAGGGELRFDGQIPSLLTDATLSVGQAYSLDLWRPRHSWIAVDGVWGESSVGPTAEDDEAAVDLDQWVTVAYYFVCDALSQNNPRGELQSWAKRRDRAAIRASPFMQWQRSAVTQRVRRRSSDRLARGGRLVGLRGWP
jgi:hypothetical protein